MKISNVPDMLVDYAAFQQWVDGQLGGKLGHEKGDPWQEFSKRFLPLTDYGKNFSRFKHNSRKTKDNGWDIEAAGNKDESEKLYIQCKFRMTSQNDLDSVISAFVPLAGARPEQMRFETMFPDNPKTHFIISTLSDLQSSIVTNYLRSGKPSVEYFRQWFGEKRIQIVDGPVIWRHFLDWYKKSFSSPTSQELHFAAPYTYLSNVYIGIVSATEIKRIYHETGDAIFFENVRDFTGQTDVNGRIATTIQEEPWNFLPLNNGIVFSASGVEEIDRSTLRIDRVSIVNGCQTTTTIGETKALDDAEFYVQVKVVVTNAEQTSWQVTHAANYQNEINRIDLDLAKFIRPQVVKKQGWLAGKPLSDDNDIWNVITVFNQQSITWKNIRIIFIGLFSREPGNMFDVNFSAVRGDILSVFLENDELNQRLFNVVFDLHEASERGSAKAKEWLEDDEESQEIFARLLGDTRAPYMQFLTILAICALADVNIAERQDNQEKEIERMKKCIAEFQRILDSEPDELDYAYFVAFEKVGSDVLAKVDSGDRNTISKQMHSRITKKDTFTKLFLQVKLGIKAAKKGRDRYR